MGVIGQVLAAPGAVAALIDAARHTAEGVETLAGTRAAPPSVGAGSTSVGPGQGADMLIPSGFDRFMDGMNRLPRPLLAFGTLALFGYAMYDPARFAARMAGLKEVPEPLWWLLGGVVGFYFGAREAHYFRARATPASPPAPAVPPVDPNPALDAWRAGGQD